MPIIQALMSSTAAAPASPCIRVCELDAYDVCLGCGRTVAEIARWTQMSVSEQWQVVARAEERRHQREESGRSSVGSTVYPRLVRAVK